MTTSTGQAIEEAHEQWQEHEEGVGGPGVTILAIAIAAVMPGILGALGSFGTAIAESALATQLLSQAVTNFICQWW